MTKTETARILTLIAAFDRRTIGETDVEAWHLILHDLNAEDCAAAVRDHYARRSDWLMPADIRSFAVSAQRRREGQTRLAQLEQQLQAENPPAELHTHPVAALTAGHDMPRVDLRTEVMRIADGRRRATEAEVAARAEHAARVEQARRELEQVRAASTPPAASETGDVATSSRSTEEASS